MGSSSSKFKKHIQHGDEYAAMQVYQNSVELRKSFDPNVGFGEHHQHNTAIHFAAKHGMKHLLRMFLMELDGNPNKRNARNETALHLACQLPLAATPSAQDRRVACVQLLLQWKGGFVHGTATMERVDLKAQDLTGSTALHYAAGSGMKRIVELLISHGAPLFLENLERLTPCDVAMRNDFHDIALLLESRMVFADAPAELLNDLTASPGPPSQQPYDTSEEFDEVYTGLRAQDLQEAKDQVVVETADMLHIPLFTAEALLRDNEWSRELLLEKWMKDPVLCCESVGLQPPLSALRLRNPELSQKSQLELSLEYLEAPPTSPNHALSLKDMDDEDSGVTCGICVGVIPLKEPQVFMSCDHLFCRDCWSNYLTLKIMEGDVHHVTCPSLGCSMRIPVELIERLVSQETARKYLHFDLNSFVATNPCIKWCPKPGCGRAVRLPEAEQQQPAQLNIPSPKPPAPTSHAVDCGNGHFFCWECLGEAHAPAGCEQWVHWQSKIAEIRPEELKSSNADTEDAANCYWLVTNCKACPNCKSPIQKNEGCNHMKCSKCKYDFCWVCLDAWKKHSSATGGYFRCNRYEAMHKADEKQGAMITEASQRNKHLQELNRFIHYYTRFKNHENSRLLEEPLLHSARRKMELLAASLPAARSPVFSEVETKPEYHLNSDGNPQIPACTRFIEDGIRDLLKARRILCGSYVYGYYLEDNGYNKTIFEFMQNELESVTEKLSEMVARPYLRTPRSSIIEMTHRVRRKGHEFTRAVSKGLIPPETPPALRRVRRRRFPGLMGMDPAEEPHEQMTEAIEASLRELDPNNPWVKDSQGRHTNLCAIYDWPDANSDEEDTDVNHALAVSLLGPCSRPGCGRPRARNPRTGKVHEFCSLRCSRYESLEQPGSSIAAADFAMDLVIALEMSRLQLIEDEMRKQHQDQPSSSTQWPPLDVGDYSEEAQLRLAIHLSLEDNRLVTKEAAGATANSEPAAAAEPSSPAPDSTVDYFLRSLSKHELSLRNFDCETNEGKTEKSLFQERNVESEGRFEISDLHQNSGFFSSSLSEDQQLEMGSDGVTSSSLLFKRSRSACDLRTGNSLSRGNSSFELESHDCVQDLVENIARAPPTRTLLRLQSLGTDFGSDEFVPVSNEGTPTQEYSIQDKFNLLAAPKEKKQKPKLVRQTNVAGSDTDNERGSPQPNLTLPSCIPDLHNAGGVTAQPSTSSVDETTAAEEDHDDQGIPRSPTLFISGVTISRTPEPEACTSSMIRSSRSSSVTGSLTRSGCEDLRRGLSKSAGRLNNSNVADLRETSNTAKKTRDLRRLTMPAVPYYTGAGGTVPVPLSPFPLPSPRVVSRSACEPQREKEVFYFPKSPTESALSSVLLVREGTKTRDAFHEALFLPRSPRLSDQRRKRSKKTAQLVTESLTATASSSTEDRQPSSQESSAL